MMRRVLAALAVIMVEGVTVQAQSDITNNWMLGPFVKQDSVNPVLSPRVESLFECPIRKTSVRWESKDVFNPAAIVRNDTLFLLYRAQDSIGKPVGTSRIGLAYGTADSRIAVAATQD